MILTLADKVAIVNLALEEIENEKDEPQVTTDLKELERLEKLAMRWRDALEAKGP